MFITWEELRDLSRPDHLHRELCINLHKTKHADRAITDAAIPYIKEEQPDFLFLYLGNTDEEGGHDRTHGHDIPEDMTIPVIFCGPRFKKGEVLSGVSIKDIAPTIARLLDVPFAR